MTYMGFAQHSLSVAQRQEVTLPAWANQIRQPHSRHPAPEPPPHLQHEAPVVEGLWVTWVQPQRLRVLL
jgi:hypothetical protein